METRRAICERTTMYVSLDLDGELSRFERALLTRHLRTCLRCAAEARRLVALTEALRAAPLLPVTPRIVVTRPRRRVGPVVQSAIAGVAVVVVGAWFGLESTSRPLKPEPLTNPIPSANAIAASDGRYDWPAGLPRSPHVLQLVPGGLYTSGAGV